jgi:hypothetical protein
MESVMIRILLLACFALAAILLVQSNLSATEYQAQTTTRLAQDESGMQTAPDPSTSDTGTGDDSGKPAKDEE